MTKRNKLTPAIDKTKVMSCRRAVSLSRRDEKTTSIGFGRRSLPSPRNTLRRDAYSLSPLITPAVYVFAGDASKWMFSVHRGETIASSSRMDGGERK